MPEARGVVARLYSALTKNLVPARQRRAMQVRDCYRRWLDTDDGREILADLVRHGATDPVMVAGDPYATHFRLGQFDVVQHIRVQAAVTDRQILQAVDERAERDRRAIEEDEHLG